MLRHFFFRVHSRVSRAQSDFKFVSASRRCNGRKATARLSNQHARSVRSPEITSSRKSLIQTPRTPLPSVRDQFVTLRLPTTSVRRQIFSRPPLFSWSRNADRTCCKSARSLLLLGGEFHHETRARFRDP